MSDGKAYGHFSETGDEYVVTDPDTPTPWINVISNGEWGLTISNAGGGYSWYRNSQLNRITTWEQELTRDASGKWLYITEKDTGETWSAALRPAGRREDLRRCVHGIGYTRFEAEHGPIACSLTVTVPLEEACEIWIVRIENRGEREKEIDLTAYFEWLLGNHPEGNREFHKIFIETSFADNTISATKRLYPLPGSREPWNQSYPHTIAFSSSRAIGAYTHNKTTFLGRNGSYTAPRFMNLTECREAGKWGDGVCAARVTLRVAPGAVEETRFTLGVPAESGKFLDLYGDDILATIRRGWRDLLDRSTVDTPDDHFNILSNHWLKYQAISGRINGRAAYYQSSGAYGFRDQLQDALVFLPLEPRRTVERITEHASHQFREGKVLHWWHNLSKTGKESGFSDDLCWLPFVVARCVRETGKTDLLNLKAPYLDGDEDTIDGHCRKALELALSRKSARGLPLIGEGDWNDGLSSCGGEWKGESVWMAHFLCRILADYAEVMDAAGDGEAAGAYRAEREVLKKAVNEHGWDGEWYFRATLDDGTVIGSCNCEEGRVFLNPQTWSIIAGTAPEDRRDSVIGAIRKHLDREYGPLLFQPAYTKPDSRIGYLTRYAPGVRENGGVYTHAATWAVMAAAMTGDGDWAYSLYEKFCPVLRGNNPDLYRAEPYVTPGNVDGPDSELFGRGGWTWYTGSAAWLQRVMNEWILGVRPTMQGLVVKPAVPARWGGFRAKRLFRGRIYDIEVSRGKPLLELNGRELEPGSAFIGEEEVNAVTVRI